MQTTRTWIAAVVLAGSLLPAAAHADLTPQTASGIPYVSGGIGASEMAEMRKVQPEYRLWLLFARKSDGAYLSQVRVTIAAPDGRTLVETTADGPLVYANPPAGTYTVTATFDGKAISRTVKVPATGAREERFYW